MWLIGQRCKCGNIFSWLILIGRGLDLKRIDLMWDKLKVNDILKKDEHLRREENLLETIKRDKGWSVTLLLQFLFQFLTQRDIKPKGLIYMWRNSIKGEASRNTDIYKVYVSARKSNVDRTYFVGIAERSSSVIIVRRSHLFPFRTQ